MPYSLWILPLISGYFVITKYDYFKYKYQRLESQRLIFHSILYGIVIFFFFYIIRLIIDLTVPKLVPVFYNFLYQLPIRKYDFLWTSILTFLFTILMVKTLNFIYRKKKYFNWRKPVERAVDEYGDEIEQLFKQSATDGLPIQITLKNNKVYVDFTDKIPPPKESNYLKIIPLMSGYRKPISKEIVFTTEYFGALNYYNKNLEKHKTFEMDTIVKQDEILTAGIFDQDIYEIFNE
ncbi:hypothetical protein SAMN05444483_101735 [Salegentibacter echinorum]|uniref:Uncharacterized protein n=2 Tax=Salegentibacter echinorum TaxID=1073325 RepID=A0A1M5CZH1_SALEC|nr:hypothetical protein SAMN05444483_101735 [Salegentibacter echinorum]